MKVKKRADEFFFYIVLDNMDRIVRNEKQKKILEKLCIVQSLIQPTMFSLVCINNAVVDEVESFGHSLFDKYMFMPVFMRAFTKE